MWKYLISFCFIVPAWHMKVASKSWLSTNYKSTKWNPLTRSISVNTWISRRPLIWTAKMLEAALTEGRFSVLQPTETSQIQWLIHVSVIEIHQVLWGSRSRFIQPPNTHPKTQTPFLPLPAALTPNPKTEDQIYSVSRSNRPFSLHSYKTQWWGGEN